MSLTEDQGQLGFNIHLEQLSGHGPVNHPGRHQFMTPEPCDKCLVFPETMGGVINQAFASRPPPCLLEKFGIDARLVKEDKPVYGSVQERQTPLLPQTAFCLYITAMLIAGINCLFLCEKPSWCSRRAMLLT